MLRQIEEFIAQAEPPRPRFSAPDSVTAAGTGNTCNSS
jgi:hypothetical protein